MTGPSTIALSLLRGSSPSEREKSSIEILYSRALSIPWVATFASCPDDGGNDLKSTLDIICREPGTQWTRSLVIQAAMVDLLTAADFPPDIDDRGVAEHMRTAFSNFVSGQTLNQLDNTTRPKHVAQFYLRIWWALKSNSAVPAGHLTQTAFKQFTLPALEQSALDPASQAGGSDSADVSGLEMLSRAALEYTSPPGTPTDERQQQTSPKTSKKEKVVHQSTSSAAKGSRSTTCGTQSTQNNMLCRSRSSSDNSGQDLRSAEQNNLTARALGGSTQSSDHTTEISCDEDDEQTQAPQHSADGVTVRSCEKSRNRKIAQGKSKGKSSKVHHSKPRNIDNVDDDDELDEVEFRKKVQSVFHLPISEAANTLGVGVTVLKKQCRRINIPRWPYRKLASVEKLIESVEKVMNEDGSTVGCAAVAELQELRKKIFDDPSLELDQQTKRLRQANFKQQYKLRQERSCKELTDVEQEALLACGAVEVLGDMDMENGIHFENTVSDAHPATCPSKQGALAGDCEVPTPGNANVVDGLFVAKQDASNANKKRKTASSSMIKADEVKADQQQCESDLPLAARRARRSTKLRRYHLSESDGEDEEHGPLVTTRAQADVAQQGRPHPPPQFPFCGRGVLPQVGMFHNLAPQLYLQNPCLHQGRPQLPDYYSLTSGPFAGGMPLPYQPMPLVREHMNMHGAGQGMPSGLGIPAWQGQLPMDLSRAHCSQGGSLCTGGASNIHASRISGGPRQAQNMLPSNGSAGQCNTTLESILRIAPLGALPQHDAPKTS